jgi:hypothetical protein
MVRPIRINIRFEYMARPMGHHFRERERDRLRVRPNPLPPVPDAGRRSSASPSIAFTTTSRKPPHLRATSGCRETAEHLPVSVPAADLYGFLFSFARFFGFRRVLSWGSKAPIWKRWVGVFLILEGMGRVVDAISGEPAEWWWWPSGRVGAPREGERKDR